MFKVNQLQNLIIEMEVISDKLEDSINSLNDEKKAMYQEMQGYTLYYLALLKKIESIVNTSEAEKLLLQFEEDIEQFIHIAQQFLNNENN